MEGILTRFEKLPPLFAKVYPGSGAVEAVRPNTEVLTPVDEVATR